MNLISIGELIKQSWQLYTKNFKLLLQVIVWLLILNLVSVAVVFLNLPMLASLISLATAIVGIWTTIILILVIDSIYNKKPFDLKALYKAGWQKFLSYLWVSILAGVIIFIGLVLLIIPGIIFAVWLAFSTYIVVLENIKGKEALSKSKELSKNRWWAVFGRLLVPNLFYVIILFIIISLLTYVGALFTGNATEVMQQPAFWWAQLVSALLPVLAAPIFISVMTMLYNSLKRTKTEPSATEKMEMPEKKTEQPQA